ncbi:MAG: helix-turn-helix domain-containing protein [Actinomycetota bacterium]
MAASDAASFVGRVSARLDPPARPRDPLARRIADTVIADPTDRRGLAWWASELGASERTLRRRFLDETGLTFTEWHIATRMHHARALLDDGLPITIVARRCGYRTVKAFRQAYRSYVAAGPEPDLHPSLVGGPTSPEPTVRPLLRTNVVVDSLGRTVSVPRDPQRIAALHEFTIGDPLLSFGAPVVAMAVDHDSLEWDPGVSGVHDLGDIAPVGSVAAPDVEALREVEPDLIIAYSIGGLTFEGCDLDELQRIAPTVAIDEDLPFDDHVALLARLAGRDEELRRQRATYRATIGRLAESMPGPVRERVYASLVIHGGALSFHTRVNPNPIGLALRDLGLRLADVTEERVLYAQLRPAAEVSRCDDAEVLFVESRSEHPSTIERWHDLRAVRSGHVYEVPSPAGVSYSAAARAAEALSPLLREVGRAA